MQKSQSAEKAKKEWPTDEEQESMLNEFQVIEPVLYCSSQKRVSRLCVNPECKKPSLICNKLQCKSCGNGTHLKCSSVLFNGVTNMLTDRANRQKQFLRNVSEIENKFINSLSESRKKISEKYQLGDLEEKYLDMFYEIYQRKDGKKISGKEAKDLFQRLEVVNPKTAEHTKVILQNYDRTMQKIIDEMIELKERLYESFVKVQDIHKKEPLKIDSVILNGPVSPNLEEMKTYSSIIAKSSKTLIAQLQTQQLNFLDKALNYPKGLQLLFRASQSNFSAQAFHAACDKKPNTLTLVRTEQGKIIGGFSQYPWESTGQEFSENGKHCFLISLDRKQKLIPMNSKWLIYNKKQYGPTFGQGFDLHLSDKCNVNYDSKADFPTTYNLEGVEKYEKSEDSYRTFSGAQKNPSFKVLEYEVFRVTYH